MRSSIYSRRNLYIKTSRKKQSKIIPYKMERLPWRGDHLYIRTGRKHYQYRGNGSLWKEAKNRAPSSQKEEGEIDSETGYRRSLRLLAGHIYGSKRLHDLPNILKKGPAGELTKTRRKRMLALHILSRRTQRAQKAPTQRKIRYRTKKVLIVILLLITPGLRGDRTRHRRRRSNEGFIIVVVVVAIVALVVTIIVIVAQNRGWRPILALLSQGPTRPSLDLVIKLGHSFSKLHSTKLSRQRFGPLEKIIGDLRICQQAAWNRTRITNMFTAAFAFTASRTQLVNLSPVLWRASPESTLLPWVGCWRDGRHQRRQARHSTLKGARSSLVCTGWSAWTTIRSLFEAVSDLLLQWAQAQPSNFGLTWEDHWTTPSLRLLRCARREPHRTSPQATNCQYQPDSYR